MVALITEISFLTVPVWYRTTNQPVSYIPIILLLFDVPKRKIREHSGQTCTNKI